jgi:hypothetical protein
MLRGRLGRVHLGLHIVVSFGLRKRMEEVNILLSQNKMPLSGCILVRNSGFQLRICFACSASNFAVKLNMLSGTFVSCASSFPQIAERVMLCAPSHPTTTSPSASDPSLNVTFTLPVLVSAIETTSFPC